MKVDATPIQHAAMAAAVQAIAGYFTGDWATGAALACIWFIAREHTQAEYRWIEKFGWDYEAEGHLRRNMPWWGGFDPRVWNTASVLDWLIPVLACAGIYYIQGTI